MRKEMEAARTLIKNLTYSFFKAIGCYQSYRYKHKDKPIVLTYHGVLPTIPKDKPDYEYRNFVTVNQFETQIRFLLSKYNPLQIYNFCEGNPDLGGGFLITFDDGFRNNFSYALPILQKYGLQAIFFITTNFIGSREFLWTEQVTRLIQETERKVLQVELEKVYEFRLGAALNRERASMVIRKYLKRQPPVKRNQILEQIKSQLNDVELAMNKEDEERYLFMDWEEVQALANAGQAIGSHTHTHPVLSTLSEEESQLEFRRSKEAIEKYTDTPCLALSYPNGEKDDFSVVHQKQLKSLGYKCAFTQIPFHNMKKVNKFAFPRFNISLKMTMTVVEATVCGFKKFYS